VVVLADHNIRKHSTYGLDFDSFLFWVSHAG
jgi:hypothetical protein